MPAVPWVCAGRQADTWPRLRESRGACRHNHTGDLSPQAVVQQRRCASAKVDPSNASSTHRTQPSYNTLSRPRHAQQCIAERRCVTNKTPARAEVLMPANNNAALPAHTTALSERRPGAVHKGMCSPAMNTESMHIHGLPVVAGVYAPVHEGCMRQAFKDRIQWQQIDEHYLLQWADSRPAAACMQASADLFCGADRVISAKHQMAPITYQVPDTSRCGGNPCGARNSRAKLSSAHLDDWIGGSGIRVSSKPSERRQRRQPPDYIAAMRGGPALPG